MQAKTKNRTAGFMFRDCSSLASLDLSGWNTGSVTNMSRMFYNCGRLVSVYQEAGGIRIKCPFPPKCLKNAKIFRAGKALLTTVHKQTRLTLVSTAGRRIRAILAKNRVDYYIDPIFGESFF